MDKKCSHCMAARSMEDMQHQKRAADQKKKMLTRLSRIEGQVRGLERMVSEDVYCPDILIQVSAVTAALNSFSKELLKNHIKNCVVEDIKAGRDETVDELVSVLQKMMK
ncbi:metal-sensing transcriptional repressor [uncultured Megasphaera sp.]|uniref:metal-sensing transcriptional repressor n=2 Tax=Megasphaera sp. TaxID=2023260 RepID=UPI0025D25E2F|nr:metal-sensing transcriptional repressor [uncultured Megasphaera sp.]